MFVIMMWTVGILALVTGAAEAQDGLRSASLPERTLGSTAGDQRDLFSVPPDFYNRPPDSEPSRLFFPQWLPTYVPAPGWYLESYQPTPVPFDRHRRVRRIRAPEPAPDVAPLPVAPPRPNVPGKPTTFYVIPGCYAGDKLPESEWLPNDCDLSKLRVVPPQ